MYRDVHSTFISGTLTLYTWEHHEARKGSRMLFRANPSSDEWPLDVAQFRVKAALAAGHNVRIENAKGEVVFEAKRGNVSFPSDVDAFWRECGQ